MGLQDMKYPAATGVELRATPGVILTRLILNACALLLTSFFLDGMRFEGFFSAFMAAVLLALVNTFIRPIIYLLTLPITIMTLGVSVLLVNGSILYLTSRIIPGFTLDGFWTIIGAAALTGFWSFLVNIFILPRGQSQFVPSSASDGISFTSVDYEIEADEDEGKKSD